MAAHPEPPVKHDESSSTKLGHRIKYNRDFVLNGEKGKSVSSIAFSSGFPLPSQLCLLSALLLSPRWLPPTASICAVHSSKWDQMPRTAKVGALMKQEQNTTRGPMGLCDKVADGRRPDLQPHTSWRGRCARPMGADSGPRGRVTWEE